MQPSRGEGLRDGHDRPAGGGRRRAPSVNNFFGDVEDDEEANLPHLARRGGVDFGSDAAGSTEPTDAGDAVTAFVAPPARRGRRGTVHPAPSVNNFFSEGDNLPTNPPDDDDSAPGLSEDTRSHLERNPAGRSNTVAPSEAFTAVTPGAGTTSPQQRKLARRVSDKFTPPPATSVCVIRVLFVALALVLCTALALGILFLLPGRALHVLQALSFPNCTSCP